MKEVLKKATEYVLENGTDLQKSCVNYLMGEGDRQSIIEELAQYQNSDGGWANGLEMEYRGNVSSPFTTAAALSHIYKFNLNDSNLLKKTLDYLKNTQYSNGMWDDPDEMNQFEHPDFMGKGIYTEYKTGIILKWLIRLKVDDREMIDRATNYMLENFDEISKKNDFWSAVAYSSAISVLPGCKKQEKIMEWSMKILMPKGSEFGLKQVMGMIEDDMPIPEQAMNNALKIIKDTQENDGGWPNPFGEYNRVWSAVSIIRFLVKNNL